MHVSLRDWMKLSGNNHEEIYNFFILYHDLMEVTKVWQNQFGGGHIHNLKACPMGVGHL
jgi:hypothetical protein